MKKTTGFGLCLVWLVLTVPLALAAEGRTPVWLPGTVINADGRYVVTRNIIGLGLAPAIDIQASFVELDLNGFLVDGGGVNAIQITGPLIGEIVIRNGLIANAFRGVERPLGLPPAGTIVVEDLQIRNVAGAGVYLADVENPVVRRVNIVITSDVVANGIELDGDGVFKNGTIEHNTIRLATEAIRVRKGSAMAIRHNRIETPFGDGILLERCVGCLIERNNISDADRHGIHLTWGQTPQEPSTGCKVFNNVIHRGETDGILIDQLCDDNLILDNVMRQCGWAGAPQPGAGGGHGLWVLGDRNHIEGNTINYNDGCGMQIDGAFNTFGRNLARGNDPSGTMCPAGSCLGLFQPDSCDNGPGNDTFGDNLIPGPPVF